MIKYFSILPMLIYLAFVWHKYGIQKSISESYYRLTKYQKPIFFVAMVSTSALVFTGYQIGHADKIAPNVILFLAASGICYTGAAAAFKDDKITNTVHYIGAMAGYFFGYLFLIFAYGFTAFWLIAPSFILMHFIKRYDKKNWLWWFEVIGMVVIWGGTL